LTHETMINTKGINNCFLWYKVKAAGSPGTGTWCGRRHQRVSGSRHRAAGRLFVVQGV